MRQNLFGSPDPDDDPAFRESRLPTGPTANLGEQRIIHLVCLDLNAFLNELSLQLGRAPERDDMSALDEGDTVTIIGFVQVVRREEERQVLLATEALEEAPDRPTMDGIEPKGRFVEEENLGTMKHTSREVERSTHSAGERPDTIVSAAGQPEEVHELRNPMSPLVGRDPVEGARELQVLRSRQIEVECRLLEDDPNPPADVEWSAHHVVACHSGGASRRSQEGGEHVDRSGLPRAVRAQKPEELPRPDLQVHLANGIKGAVALGEPIRLYSERCVAGESRAPGVHLLARIPFMDR